MGRLRGTKGSQRALKREIVTRLGNRLKRNPYLTDDIDPHSDGECVTTQLGRRSAGTNITEPCYSHLAKPPAKPQAAWRRIYVARRASNPGSVAHLPAELSLLCRHLPMQPHLPALLRADCAAGSSAHPRRSAL